MLCTGFSHLLVKYQKSYSFAALTHSISDTSTRVKIPYACVFHEVISIYFILHWEKTLLFFFALLEMTTESIDRLERHLHEKLKNNQNGRAKGSKWTAGVPPEEKINADTPSQND